MDVKVITVKEANVCGKTRYYPDDEVSNKIVSMMRTSSGRRKTLNSKDIETLEGLGFTVNIKKPRIVYD